MKNILVENLTSTNGNKVANQFLIWMYDKNGDIKTVTFQSYETQIFTLYLSDGILHNTIVFNKNAFNYSVTTTKYIKRACEVVPCLREKYDSIKKAIQSQKNINIDNITIVIDSTNFCFK